MHKKQKFCLDMEMEMLTSFLSESEWKSNNKFDAYLQKGAFAIKIYFYWKYNKKASFSE